MWKRKDLKINAKNIVKKNYWTAIVVCFLMALFTNEFGTSIIGIWQGEDSIDPNYIIKQENVIQDNEQVEEKLDEINGKEEEIENKKLSLSDLEIGILEVVEANLNNIIKSEKYLFRIWDAIELFTLKETGLGIVLVLIAIIAIAYIILIAEPLTVSGRKYFLKAREEENARMGIMKEIFKKDNWKNVTWIMLVKNTYNILWFLTIIGGIIKAYEYRMIPYILAENPKVDRKEAFKMSKQMMKHNKWKTFVLDISFIMWHILSWITFGLLNILYVNTYKIATETELYEALKQNIIGENKT